MKIKTKNLLMIALFAALTAISAQIIVPIQPVQFTLAVLVVLMSGSVLGKRDGALSQIVYILLGIVGMPVFGKFMGGLNVIIGPTGGYIIAYPVMAFLVGWISELIGKNNFWAYLPGMFAAMLVCYAMGCAWFMITSGRTLLDSLTLTVFPFIIFDLLKIIAASLLTVIIKKRLAKQLA